MDTPKEVKKIIGILYISNKIQSVRGGVKGENSNLNPPKIGLQNSIYEIFAPSMNSFSSSRS